MSTTNIDTLNDIKDITYNQESEILVIQSKDNRFLYLMKILNQLD